MRILRRVSAAGSSGRSGSFRIVSPKPGPYCLVESLGGGAPDRSLDHRGELLEHRDDGVDVVRQRRENRRADEPLSPSTARFRLRAPESIYDVRAMTTQVRDVERRELWLPPGEYDVDCDVPAGLPVIAQLPRKVAIAPGSVVELAVRLARERGVLAGRVVDWRRRGVGRVVVRATSPGHPDKRTKTDEDGAFRIRGLPETSVTIALDPTFTRGRGMFALPRDTVLPRPAIDLLLTLEPGFELHVTVRDEKSGDKINGVPLRLSPGPRQAAVIDIAQQGRAAFHHLRAGRYRLEVLCLHGEVFATRSISIETKPGASMNARMEISIPLAELKAKGR